MSNKSTLFYRENTSIILDFSAEEISSDGAIILLEKIERKEKLIDYFSKYLPDNRDPLRIKHSRYKLLKQCVFMLIQLSRC